MSAELPTELPTEIDPGETLIRDDAYFDDGPSRERSFDARLLSEPLTLLPSRPPLTLAPTDSVKTAMHAMRKRHRGCVLVTEDGSLRSPLSGIFTERDVLLKIIDSGRNPVDVELSEVMTRDPESLPIDARLAWALNMMSVGGFRHVPVTNEQGWPAFIISVRDIVEFLVESFPAEILNLPPDFRREKGLPRDGA
ncbi:MAG: CBS domain-containing protein [Myxococcota bacterium]|jgi:CBS domain-containing protein